MLFQKTSWLISENTNRFFFVASILTFVIAGVVFTQMLVSEPTVYVAQTTSQKVTFYCIFSLLSVMVIVQFVLWIGMLIFTLFASQRSVARKLLWLLLQLIFVSLGSAVAYFKLYRPALSSVRNLQDQPQETP